MEDHAPHRIIFAVLTCLALFATACSSGGLSVSEPTPPANEDGGTGDTGADPVAPSPTDSAAPTATPPPTSTIDPDATPAPTEPPTPTATVVAGGGAVDLMKRVQFVVGETSITNATPQSFVTGDLVLDEGKDWVIVQLGVEALSQVTWELDGATLLDADGNARSSGGVYSHTGESYRLLSFASRGYRKVFVAFPYTGGNDDLAGWTIRMDSEEFSELVIPLILPLSGPAFTNNYPLPLPHGEEATAFSGTFGGCPDGIEMETRVDAAEVSLEESDERARRASPGERVVHVRLALTNSTDDDSNCIQLVLWDEFRLEADGQSIAASAHSKGPVEPGATAVFFLTYVVPAAASSLELVSGVDGRPVATWDVDLPAAAGEGVPSVRQEPVPLEPEVELAGSPSGLAVEQLAAGGATGDLLGTTFEVGTSAATNASLNTVVEAQPVRDENGKTWVVTDLGIAASEESSGSLSVIDIVLEDGFGRPYQASARLQDGEAANTPIRFDGVVSFDSRIVFETPGLVTDLTGWHLVIEPDGRLPLRLPLTGEADVKWPQPLTTGASRDFSLGSFGGCTATDGDEINATIGLAELDIERSDGFGGLNRIDPTRLYIRVDVDLTNLVEAPTSGSGFDSTTSNCGAVVLWPPFLVRADGRFLQPVLSLDLLDIDYGETEPFRIVVAIPAETQTLELWAGIDPTLIVGWTIKDNGEVLEDFGAQFEDDDRTLVTLDESVLFAFGSAELSEASLAPLTRLANVLAENSTGEIVITGHTDAIGTDAANEQLSVDRADAVASFLIDAGIDADRITAVGAGESTPIAPNENEDGSDNAIGRAQNRRVEILFTAAE